MHHGPRAELIRVAPHAEEGADIFGEPDEETALSNGYAPAAPIALNMLMLVGR